MDKTAVALYLRLSNEDSDKGKLEESNSISAQRVLLTKHVEELPAPISTDRAFRH